MNLVDMWRNRALAAETDDLARYREWCAAHLPNCVVAKADSTGVWFRRVGGRHQIFIGAKAFMRPETLDMIEGFFGEDGDAE